MAPEWTSALLTIGARAVELLLVEEAVQSNLRQCWYHPNRGWAFSAVLCPVFLRGVTLLSLCSLVAE